MTALEDQLEALEYRDWKAPPDDAELKDNEDFKQS